MLTAIALTLTLAAGAETARPLPSYDHAIRCAGLAEAAYAKGDADTQAKLFDVAFFWGLAGAEVARKERHAAGSFKADQVKAKAKAGADFARDPAGTDAELQACVAETPPV